MTTIAPGVDFSPLKTQLRAGVPHYVPGQHEAFADGDHALLLYVDAMGHACVVPCERGLLGQWYPMGVAYREGANGVGGWRRLPRRYQLSRAARAALAALDDEARELAA